MTISDEDLARELRKARNIGPLQPGDIVSVRGVVERGPIKAAQSMWVRLPAGNGDWFRPEDLTLIERPAPPEPDWQIGDVARLEGSEDLYVMRKERYGKGWYRLSDGFRFQLSEIPGTLIPCDIVRREKTT